MFEQCVFFFFFGYTNLINVPGHLWVSDACVHVQRKSLLLKLFKILWKAFVLFGLHEHFSNLFSTVLCKQGLIHFAILSATGGKN